MAMADRNPRLSAYVLLARRATLRLDLGLVESLAALDWADAVAALVDAPVDEEQVGALPESEGVIVWWTQRMVRPGAGLQDRMAFFWHTLLTTHRWATDYQQLIGPQINALRANALGNFRTLLHAFTTDAALIGYLDANSSTAERPNENLARELMELFTVGRGHYSEDDVRAAALALTGWRIDEGSYGARFDPARAHTGPVTFLGETRPWDTASIVDRLCDHPATAARISALLWYHLVGTELAPEQSAELGAWWQGQQLEIKPLVTRILNDPQFRAEHYRRPRSGFEYFVALQSATGIDPSKLWMPRHVGQALYEPPNVAGWPQGERWLDADSQLRRAGLVFSLDHGNWADGRLPRTIDEMLDRAGLVVINDATVNAITDAGNERRLDDESRAQLRWRLTLTSPEFQLT